MLDIIRVGKNMLYIYFFSKQRIWWSRASGSSRYVRGSVTFSACEARGALPHNVKHSRASHSIHLSKFQTKASNCTKLLRPVISICSSTPFKTMISWYNLINRSNFKDKNWVHIKMHAWTATICGEGEKNISGQSTRGVQAGPMVSLSRNILARSRPRICGVATTCL